MTSLTQTAHIIGLAIALSSCADERLRDLGKTIQRVEQPDPGFEPTTPPDGCEPVFVDSDAVQRLVADDLAAASPAARPFLRYISLAERLDEGICDVALDRAAVSKLVNSTSRSNELVAPTPIGDGPTALRIDLRDYGWTAAVSIDGQSHADGWEALIARSPFAIELDGPEGAFNRRETGTRVPVLASDAFLAAATDASAYYALVGIPETLGELRQLVGLPAVLDPVENEAVRTGVRFSRVLRSEGNVRVLDRYPIANGTAGTYVEAEQVDTSAFLADPLRVQPDVQRLITFTLPNDMLAFAVMDATGQRQAAGELVLDTNRNDFTARVLTSCTNCHASGAIPAVDDVGNVILANPDLFDAEIVAAYQASPGNEQRFALFEIDSGLYVEALERIGAVSTGDPIGARIGTIELDVELPAAAGALLVRPEVLAARLDELPSRLLPLALDLNLSRLGFGEQFTQAYCTLHQGDVNPPSTEACAIAP